MDQNPETQAVESLLLNECEIKFFLFFHSHMHRSSKAWARTTSSVRPSMTTSPFVDNFRFADQPAVLTLRPNRSQVWPFARFCIRGTPSVPQTSEGQRC